jgi:hypothetical protein
MNYFHFIEVYVCAFLYSHSCVCMSYSVSFAFQKYRRDVE